MIAQNKPFWNYLNFSTYTPDIDKCVLAHLDILSDKAKYKAAKENWPEVLITELQKQIMMTKREFKACMARDNDQILIEIPFEIQHKIDNGE